MFFGHYIPDKRLYSYINFFARPAKLRHDFLVRTPGADRVLDRPMDPPDLGWRPGTGFGGIIAEGDDDIHGPEESGIDLLGPLGRYVDPNLPHDRDRPRVDAGGYEACTVRLDPSLPGRTGEAFRHLAPPGVTGAE